MNATLKILVCVAVTAMPYANHQALAQGGVTAQSTSEHGGGDASALPWQLLLALVPRAPTEAEIVYEMAAGHYTAAHIVPQVAATAEAVVASFGRPAQVASSTAREFRFRHDGQVAARRVSGELWDYSPVSVMVLDDRVIAIWIDGPTQVERLATLWTAPRLRTEPAKVAIWLDIKQLPSSGGPPTSFAGGPIAPSVTTLYIADDVTGASRQDRYQEYNAAWRELDGAISSHMRSLGLIAHIELGVPRQLETFLAQGTGFDYACAVDVSYTRMMVNFANLGDGRSIAMSGAVAVQINAAISGITQTTVQFSTEMDSALEPVNGRLGLEEAVTQTLLQVLGHIDGICMGPIQSSWFGEALAVEYAQLAPLASRTELLGQLDGWRPGSSVRPAVGERPWGSAPDAALRGPFRRPRGPEPTEAMPQAVAVVIADNPTRQPLRLLVRSEGKYRNLLVGANAVDVIGLTAGRRATIIASRGERVWGDEIHLEAGRPYVLALPR